MQFFSCFSTGSAFFTSMQGCRKRAMKSYSTTSKKECLSLTRKTSRYSSKTVPRRELTPSLPSDAVTAYAKMATWSKSSETSWRLMLRWSSKVSTRALCAWSKLVARRLTWMKSSLSSWHLRMKSRVSICFHLCDKLLVFSLVALRQYSNQMNLSSHSIDS